jgi:hypothetical protein
MTTGTERTLSEHKTVVESTEMGVQAQCPCGWRGVDRCLRSDDYAWTNAAEEGKKHQRYAAKVAVVDLREEEV